MLAKDGKKYPRIKVLVVHPSKLIRDRVASYVHKFFGCKVTTTTNYERALSKIEKAASVGGPASDFHMIISAYDISSPSTGENEQGPALVKALRSNPLTKDICIILEEAGHKVTDIDANAFVPSLEKMEGFA